VSLVLARTAAGGEVLQSIQVVLLLIAPTRARRTAGIRPWSRRSASTRAQRPASVRGSSTQRASSRPTPPRAADRAPMAHRLRVDVLMGTAAASSRPQARPVGRRSER
jgi:hypothetical protein